MIKTKGADGFAFEYIAELVKKDSAAVISTTTFGHFLQQLESEQFVNTLKADTNKKNNFIDTYKAFMLLGDAAITYAGANALNNQDLPLKSWISDYGFINNCLENLTIPRDIETWLALQNVIKATSDTTYQIPPMPKGNKEIDWAVLKDIKQGERFQMLTSKGPITLELFTEEAPGTVAMFTQLATQGFYNGKTIHRHVPDFVVQGGCPRGDGFGGLPETIRSEFSLREYDQEGLLGIASAGKDTESCQFFITHSPTPHLSGKYTIFARVTDGMEVVHQLEVGDTVEKVSK
jgi:cyclophilin family peptidyl-prolyl cis-trans isomerase